MVRDINEITGTAENPALPVQQPRAVSLPAALDNKVQIVKEYTAQTDCPALPLDQLDDPDDPVPAPVAPDASFPVDETVEHGRDVV